MATIKSYTDISQSKKLAEILPLESADMHYKVNRHNNESKIFMIPYSDLGYYKDNDYQYSVCAWSLATLLELLPKRLEIVDNVYELSVYLYGLYYWNINNGNLCFESKDKDNLVDACYEMIIKLHELNLL